MKMDMVSKQNEEFSCIRNQNNFLLGFIGILLGILFSGTKWSSDYRISYYGIVFSLLLSFINFFVLTFRISIKEIDNEKKIKLSIWLMRLSAGFMMISVLLFSGIYIWRLP